MDFMKLYMELITQYNKALQPEGTIEDVKQMKTLLEKYPNVLEDEKNKQQQKSIEIILITMLVGLAIFFLVENVLIKIVLSIILAVVSIYQYLINRNLNSFFVIPAEVMYLKSIKENGWQFADETSDELLEKFSKKYVSLDLGDISNNVSLATYGECSGLKFCYFEYDYTIEIEEEVSYYDEDDNIYYETEYSEENYTHCYFAIEIKSNIVNINITPDTNNSYAIKFSNIELNKYCSVFSYDEHSSRKFIDADTQLLILDLYKVFSMAKVDISRKRILLSIPYSLEDFPREVEMDSSLVNKLENEEFSDYLSLFLWKVCPIAKKLQHYKG